MDEFYVGQMVDTPDGIGEVVDAVEGDPTEPPYYIVKLEGSREEIEYQEFELTPLEDYDYDLDDDSDLDPFDTGFEGDEDEARAEFGDDEEDDL